MSSTREAIKKLSPTEHACVLEKKIHTLLKENKPHLTENKRAVLTELSSYVTEIAHPGLVRTFARTNPNRVKNIELLLDVLEQHDSEFLLKTLDNVLKIEDKSSDFRDKVGKRAASQFIQWSAGGIELILLTFALESFSNGELGETFKYSLYTFLTDRTEKLYQSILEQYKRLPDGMNIIAGDLVKSLLRGMWMGVYHLATSHANQLVQSVPSIPSTLYKSAVNVGTNVWNFAYSFLYHPSKPELPTKAEPSTIKHVL